MSKKPMYLHFDENFFAGFRQSFVQNKADEEYVVDAREILDESNDSDEYLFSYLVSLGMTIVRTKEGKKMKRKKR